MPTRPPSAPGVPVATLDAVRRFNRLYTQRIGVLGERYLHSDLTLSQGRVLYEAARPSPPAAADVVRELGLDPAFVSRLLKGLERDGLVRRTASREDGRRALIHLTAKGRRVLATLQARSRDQVGALLAAVPASARPRLLAAMDTIAGLLGGTEGDGSDRSPEPERRYTIRGPQPGDMGWVVAQHGLVYVHEYGWDWTFEAWVAGIVRDFVLQFDAASDRCWIAEMDGRPVGSVFLVRKSKTVGKLRLLVVDEAARGLGLGARLVDECIEGARAIGYRTLTLWTNSELDAARHVYERAGFVMVQREAPAVQFGKEQVFETWERRL